ncbi:hypothetical protein [Pectobacterium phage CX5]|uniref:dATP/dGTP diphosphohydrolase N-terminal domain-containing protein n=1 Tax=Pectobacterium phage CX5 TaxID=2652426 RepID=A0A5P8D4M7_9CAUD|nr:hypothetical protein [Pectobacterium phage CX5]QFP93626.1 hypothetical protein [Pectobacterium phage CX5-1]
MQKVFPVGSKVMYVDGSVDSSPPKGTTRTVADVPTKWLSDAWAHKDDIIWFSTGTWSPVKGWQLVANPTGVVSDGMKYDGGKPRMDLLLSGCPQALTQVAEILTFGAAKYAAHSWQTVPQGEERYLAALLRHLTAHAGGEDKDAESGMSHLAHAACNALFILELEARRAKSKPTV